MKRSLVAWCLVLLVSLLPISALAKNSNPGVLPPNSRPHGATYGEWAGRWLQWALAQPASVNPVLDETGEHCAEGQTGKVWFLAGTFFQPGGETAVITRDCTIPTGTALFFPVLNQTWITVDQDVLREYEEIVTQFLTPSLDCLLSGEGCEPFGIPDTGTTLEVIIDGVPVDLQVTNEVNSPYRVLSPSFDVTLPPGNIFGVVPTGSGEPSCPAAGNNVVCSPSATEGIYLMLAPLSAGEHTIQIKAAGFFDVTYNLTVKGKKQAAAPRGQGTAAGQAEELSQEIFVPLVTNQ